MYSIANATDIPVSSLTYAIKGQKLLERYGYVAWTGRNHDRVTGCGYKITVRGDAQKARQILLENGIKLAQTSSSQGRGGRP